MFKIKLMNYDASEYEVLEYDLQLLASRGYTCTSISYITFFRKDNRNVHYVTDIFQSTAATNFSKQEEKYKWLGKYYEKEYQVLGHIKNVYVFQGEKNIVPTKNINASYKIADFEKKHKLKKIVWLLVSMMLAFQFIPSAFSNTEIGEFTTNGSIILHYIPVPIFLIFLLRSIYSVLQTIKLDTKQNTSLTIIKQKRIHDIYTTSIIITLLILIIGVILESYNQKEVVIDPQNVLTLETLGVPGNTSEYPTYTERTSILIPYSYTYLEQSDGTPTDEEGNILHVRYYECKDNNTVTSFASNIIDFPNSVSAKEINPIAGYEGCYLAISKITNIADTMIIVKETTLIIITTSFDLSSATYQQIIIDFYY